MARALWPRHGWWRDLVGFGDLDTLTSTAGPEHGSDPDGPVRGPGMATAHIAAAPIADEDEAAPGSRRLAILALGAVLLLAAGWYTLHKLMTPPPVVSADANAQTVTVIVPGRTTVQASVTTSGVLAARRDLPVGVAGEGGRVVSVLVDAGAMVKKGQVLAVIDRSVQAEQIASQAAGVEVQAANARLAQSKLDRALKLVSAGFISNADIESLTASRDAAVAQVRVARATLAQLQASAARLNVVAPEAGLVLTRQVEPGQIVGPGSGTLFRIAKDGELEMQARLSESNLARMAVGDAADVVPVGTTRHFTGHVWQLAPTIDPTTRQGIARIALPFDLALRPGGFASATLASGITTAPVLPETAVLADANGAYVYVVGRDNRVERRAIATGDVTRAGVTVIKGLTGSEHVVLRAGGFLNAGDRVRPVSDRDRSAH